MSALLSKPVVNSFVLGVAVSSLDAVSAWGTGMKPTDKITQKPKGKNLMSQAVKRANRWGRHVKADKKHMHQSSRQTPVQHPKEMQAKGKMFRTVQQNCKNQQKFVQKVMFLTDEIAHLEGKAIKATVGSKEKGTVAQFEEYKIRVRNSLRKLYCEAEELAFPKNTVVRGYDSELRLAKLTQAVHRFRYTKLSYWTEEIVNKRNESGLEESLKKKVNASLLQLQDNVLNGVSVNPGRAGNFLRRWVKEVKRQSGDLFKTNEDTAADEELQRATRMAAKAKEEHNRGGQKTDFLEAVELYGKAARGYGELCKTLPTEHGKLVKYEDLLQAAREQLEEQRQEVRKCEDSLQCKWMMDRL